MIEHILTFSAEFTLLLAKTGTGGGALARALVLALPTHQHVSQTLQRLEGKSDRVIQRATRAHARAFTKRGSSSIAPLLSIDSRDRKTFSTFLRDLVVSSVRASQMATSIVFVYFDSSFRFESSNR